MVILLSYPSSHLSLILPILSLYSPRSHSPNIPSPSPDAPSLPCGGRDADERGGGWRRERGGGPWPASTPEARERGGGSAGERGGEWRRERGGGPGPASALRRSVTSTRKAEAGGRDGSGSALNLWVSRANGLARHKLSLVMSCLGPWPGTQFWHGTAISLTVPNRVVPDRVWVG